MIFYCDLSSKQVEIIKDKNRVFILGAGFSKSAGLPLCAELFKQILKEARYRYRHVDGFVLDSDIQKFLRYQGRAKGREIAEEDINFEDFISYLDIEHFLQLKGSDHWSDEGNVTQIIIRNLIAYILNERESLMDDKDFHLYEKFAEKLKPGDIIITFNYDTILENTFSRMNIPYRLYPERYKRVYFGGGESLDTNEIVLLKMHGSIDWFSIAKFDREQESLRGLPLYTPPRDEVFARQEKPLNLDKIIDEPYPSDSPLQKIYRNFDLAEYLSIGSFSSAAPLIISPSHSKMVYLNPLTEFWYGYNRSGIGNGTVAVIGFSLPEHDEYIRQPLYHLINNFQNNDYYKGVIEKTNLKMIDYKQSQPEIDAYKENYGFVDWSRTDCYFDGFNEESLDIIFDKIEN
jgi:hypothetical protein